MNSLWILVDPGVRDPKILGPFPSEQERISSAAEEWKMNDTGWCDHVWRINVENGVPKVLPFSKEELENGSI